MSNDNHIDNITHPIAKRLLSLGLIDLKQLNLAYHESKKERETVLNFIAKNRIVTSDKLNEQIVTHFNLEIINASDIEINQIPIDVLPKSVIEQSKMLPIKIDKKSAEVIIFDPSDFKSIDAIKFYIKVPIKFKFMDFFVLDTLIKRYLVKSFGEFPDKNVNRNIVDKSTDPLVIYINQIFENAINKQASDIHIEPYENYCRIRFRIDGILSEIAVLNNNMAEQLASRIKIMSSLNIAEKRLPQDGRCQFSLQNGVTVDFRVSTCPTLFGEKIVIRILDKTNLFRDIDQLGFSINQKSIFIKTISEPQGLILVTGPTGSGKTITLYAALHYLNQPEKNIITIEDPVEINLPGINQVQINEKAGLKFANALRSFLRQDPDIIMIGEIRDRDTAEIAIKAAQTGHLVIATLHTNSVSETLIRLQNIGIESYNLKGSIKLITAQRLIRKLCPICKQPDLPNFKNQSGNIYKAVGCQNCIMGYFGRIAIHEVLPISENTFLFENGKSVIAQQENFITLKEMAMQNVLNGVTSISEIQRVIDIES